MKFDQLTQKVIKVIENSDSVTERFTPSSRYTVCTRHYFFGLLELQYYNGLFKAIFDGIFIGYIRDEKATAVKDAINACQERQKSNVIKKFLAS